MLPAEGFISLEESHSTIVQGCRSNFCPQANAKGKSIRSDTYNLALEGTTILKWPRFQFFRVDLKSWRQLRYYWSNHITIIIDLSYAHSAPNSDPPPHAGVGQESAIGFHRAEEFGQGAPCFYWFLWVTILVAFIWFCLVFGHPRKTTGNKRFFFLRVSIGVL